MTPKVSVIIPSFNHEKVIKGCIQSILDQTFQDFELLIADDASKDHAVDIIKDFADPRIKLSQQAEDQGIFSAANNCIRQSKGKYVAWINPEDIWIPRKLELQVNYLEQHPESGAVFGKVDWVDDTGQLILDPGFSAFHEFDVENRSRHEWLRHFFYEGNCLCISSSLVRRECLEETGLFDPALANLSDFDLWIRICFRYEIHVLDQKLARLRRTGEEYNPGGDNIQSRTRERFEHKQLLDHYLKIQDTREFLLVFPETAGLSKISEDLIPYFLGRLAIDRGEDFMALWGLEVIHLLLKNETIALKLEEQCGFSYQNFIDLTGQMNTFNLAAKEQRDAAMRDRDIAIQERDAAIQERDARIADIYASETFRLGEFMAQTPVLQLGKRAVSFTTKLLRGFSTPELPQEDPQKSSTALAKSRLHTFLSTDNLLELPAFTQPTVSIILLFHNRAEMSLQCLETLVRSAELVPFEVVIVDNASIDQTSVLLDRVRNAKIVRNGFNRGFGGGCNQAVDLATGKYLLFLNNDTQILPDSLKVLTETIESEKNIGAVGGKLIFPDGRLQEAGSIIWQDGSCSGYGRNDDPAKSEYSYQRDVDFCSGALLLTPRELFLSLGKFDPRYEPAYYEDADYCMLLWEKGYRVIYQPFAGAIHFEFGSSGQKAAMALQTENRQKFVRKWQHILVNFYLHDPTNILFSREHESGAKRILIVDDQVPDYRLGSGLPRTYRTLQALAEMGYKLTFFPVGPSGPVPEIARGLQLMGIEVMYLIGDGRRMDFGAFLKARLAYYDTIFVSRPHNLQDVKQHLKDYARKSAVVYDAEAIFSFRELKFNELLGWNLLEAEKERLLQNEVSLVKEANVITAVSPMEKDLFKKYGAAEVHVLSHVVEPEPTPAAFDERQDILFVGGILGSPSPNEDAVLYFVNQILPLVRQEVQCGFYIVGTNRVKAIQELDSEFIHVIGRVDDLTYFYNRCRLFVAPSRYAAGIPLKILDAAAHGLPTVATPPLVNQLGWQENRDLLVGRDPEEFAKKVIELYSNRELFYSLRQNGLERIREEYSPERFTENLENVIRSATKIRSEQK